SLDRAAQALPLPATRTIGGRVLPHLPPPLVGPQPLARRQAFLARTHGHATRAEIVLRPLGTRARGAATVHDFAARRANRRWLRARLGRHVPLGFRLGRALVKARERRVARRKGRRRRFTQVADAP